LETTIISIKAFNLQNNMNNITPKHVKRLQGNSLFIIIYRKFTNNTSELMFRFTISIQQPYHPYLLYLLCMQYSSNDKSMSADYIY